MCDPLSRRAAEARKAEVLAKYGRLMDDVTVDLIRNAHHAAEVDHWLNQHLNRWGL